MAKTAAINGVKLVVTDSLFDIKSGVVPGVQRDTLPLTDVQINLLAEHITRRLVDAAELKISRVYKLKEDEQCAPPLETNSPYKQVTNFDERIQ